MNAENLKAELAQYYGGETIYRHALNAKFNYTEGMKALFKHAGGGAYWLSDILATEPAISKGVRQHGFCVAILQVVGTVGVLTVAMDYSENAEPGQKFHNVSYTRTIDFTDFPEGDWKFYLAYTTVGSSDVVMAMLPREN